MNFQSPPTKVSPVPVGNISIDPSAISRGKLSASAVPAIVIVQPETAGLRIAALTLLDRLIVALHRGGAGPIILITEAPLPALTRTRALRIPYETASSIPQGDGPILFAHTNLLVQAADVRRCIESRGRLATPEGDPLAIGMIPSGSAATDSDTALKEAPVIAAKGVAQTVTNQSSATEAERRLWASLTSSSDGFIDKVFNRPCGRALLSKILIHTPVSPNMVSVASILIGVASGFFFASGTHAAAVWGALLLQLSAIIDCVDGDIARIVFKESPLGKWLDLAGDQLVHIAIFAGIAVGVSKSAATPELIWLGVSAVLGALLSFAVVVRGMRSPSPNSQLQRLIDSATNRDFSVLIIVLAALNQLKIFLWLAAIGSHLFWITALALQLAARPSRSTSALTK